MQCSTKSMAKTSKDRPKVDVVYKNELYTVTVGESKMLEGVVVYLCINNCTGVIEAEEQMLPRVIDYADQLCEKITEMVTSGMDIYPDTRVTALPTSSSVQ